MQLLSQIATLQLKSDLSLQERLIFLFEESCLALNKGVLSLKCIVLFECEVKLSGQACLLSCNIVNLFLQLLDSPFVFRSHFL